MDTPFRVALGWEPGSNPYGEQAIRGVASYGHRFGVFQFLINRNGEFDLGRMRDRLDVHGMIVYQSGDGLKEVLWPTHCPIVSVEQTVSRITPWQALPDDRAVGRLVAEDFASRKFKRLAYCPYKRIKPIIESEPWDRDRQTGFTDAAQAAGARIEVYQGTPGEWGNYDQEWRGPLAHWVASLEKPVGILAANDLRARHVLLAAESVALKVPQEVAVVGVDNDPWAQLPPHGGISTVELDGFRAGYAAARMLHQLLEGQGPNNAVIHIPPRRLIGRGTSDALAIDDQDVIKAVHFIAEHAIKGIGVQRVVDAVPLSRRTLERRFQKALGCSILEKIQSVQVERAKALLGDETIPLRRIARLSGFASSDVFGRVFRRRTRITPSSFRASTLNQEKML